MLIQAENCLLQNDAERSVELVQLIVNQILKSNER